MEVQPITVTHEDGVRFAIQIRQHSIVVDQTVRGGGEDSGPTPIELFGASLGSCVAFYVQQFLFARGLPFEGMRVEVDMNKEQKRIARFAVRVILKDAPQAQYAEMLERVARSCPAHNTLTHGADVEVAFVQEAAVA